MEVHTALSLMDWLIKYRDSFFFRDRDTATKLWQALYTKLGYNEDSFIYFKKSDKCGFSRPTRLGTTKLNAVGGDQENLYSGTWCTYFTDYDQANRYGLFTYDIVDMIGIHYFLREYGYSYKALLNHLEKGPDPADVEFISEYLLYDLDEDSEGTEEAEEWLSLKVPYYLLGAIYIAALCEQNKEHIDSALEELRNFNSKGCEYIHKFLDEIKSFFGIPFSDKAFRSLLSELVNFFFGMDSIDGDIPMCIILFRFQDILYEAENLVSNICDASPRDSFAELIAFLKNPLRYVLPEGEEEWHLEYIRQIQQYFDKDWYNLYIFPSDNYVYDVFSPAFMLGREIIYTLLPYLKENYAAA